MIKIFFFVTVFCCGCFVSVFLNLDLFSSLSGTSNSILLNTLVLKNTYQSIFFSYYDILVKRLDLELLPPKKHNFHLLKSSNEVDNLISNSNFYQKNIFNKWANLFNSDGYRKIFSILIFSSKNFYLAQEVFLSFEDTSPLISLETIITRQQKIWHRIKIYGFFNRQSAIDYMKLNDIKGIVLVDY